MSSKPKLRIFAGPNGSGKTTLYNSIKPVYFSTRLFVNADLLEAGFKQKGFLNFSDFDIKVDQDIFSEFCLHHGLFQKAGFFDNSWNLVVKENVLVPADGSVNTDFNSYHFAIIADFIRHRLIEAKHSFSFETVFSHPDKLKLIDLARQRGYNIYLYFIGTESPTMNVERVRDRIRKGGHSVNEDKIATRYFLTMDLLMNMLRSADEAYLWDNSGEKHQFVGTFKDKVMSFETHSVPGWIAKFILDKITGK